MLCESAKVVFNRLMTRVFIDESGNLGRGGRFFVLAAIVFLTRQSAKKASRYVRKMQKRLGAKGSPLAELKSCRMSFVERQMLLNGLMASGDIEFYILAFGKDKNDIRAMIENLPDLSDVERKLYLNRFDEALNFYRSHPAVDLLGAMLGISKERMDKFFDSKDYKDLLPSY